MAADELKHRTGKSFAQMAREIGVAVSTFRNYRCGHGRPPAERTDRVRQVLQIVSAPGEAAEPSSDEALMQGARNR
jgi:transcriptional regulator with XRE-family HTH domain